MTAQETKQAAKANAGADTVLSVRDLHKTFHVGFFRKRVDAVRGVDFEVRPGEILGLLGPNGAGKTTTIKMILRLIFPTTGRIELFGAPVTDQGVMSRLGYMPENPYVYQYLTPHEFLDLCGRLEGMPRDARRDKSEALIKQVGLSHATDRAIGKFSKGMMQRIALAQALLHDPELLILDEPMSGLDPIGRKEVLDVLMEQRRQGKTLLFTSHILSDVERICDRVVIMNHGKITAAGTLDELLRPEVRRVRMELSAVSDALRGKLADLGDLQETSNAQLVLVVEGDQRVAPALEACAAEGAHVVSVVPERETLEDLFMRDAMAAGQASRDDAPGGKS